MSADGHNWGLEMRLCRSNNSSGKTAISKCSCKTYGYIRVKIRAKIIRANNPGHNRDYLPRGLPDSSDRRQDKYRFAKTISRLRVTWRFPSRCTSCRIRRGRETVRSRSAAADWSERCSSGTTARHFLKLCDKRSVVRRSVMWFYVTLLRCCK